MTPHHTDIPAADILISRFYVWQMNDGRWHASPYTNARDVPISHLTMHGHNTRAEMVAELRAWANRVA